MRPKRSSAGRGLVWVLPIALSMWAFIYLIGAALLEGLSSLPL